MKNPLKTKSKTKIATAVTTSLLITSGMAVSNIAQAEENIPEVVVTAKGEQRLADVLPTSHVITRTEIEAIQANDIPALLAHISGISTTNSGGRGSQTSVFLRGSQNSQIIVLIDGVRVGSATLGAASLNSYPVEAIERIEVVKGPLSSIYGADAVGGVIQIFTRKGGSNLGSTAITVGGNHLLEVGFALNGGNDKNGFTVSAHAEDTDGIDRTSILTNGNADEDSYEEKAFSFGGKISFNETTSAKLSMLYADNTSEFDNTFGNDGGLFSDTTTLSTALNLTSQLSKSLRWTTIAGYNKDEMVTPAPSAFPSDITTNRDSLGTELAIRLTDNHIVTVGVDYYQEDIETLETFPTTDRDNKGIYAQLQSTLGAFGLLSSLRYDDNSAHGTETNGSIALNYSINDSTRAVLSYGTAFVAPSFNLLYYPNFGNRDLLPETSESVELSILGQHQSLDWRVSAYETSIENLFSFDPVTFRAINIGEAEIKGLEFEMGTQLIRWDLRLNLDLLSAKNELTGVELDDRAEKTLSVTAGRDFGKFDLHISLEAEKDRYDNNGTELSGYGLVDISGAYHFNDKLSLSAKVNNLFDKDYTVNLIGSTERYNTEGRQTKVTLKYLF